MGTQQDGSADKELIAKPDDLRFGYWIAHDRENYLQHHLTDTSATANPFQRQKTK